MDSAQQDRVLEFLNERPQGVTGQALRLALGISQDAINSLLVGGEIDGSADRYFHPDHVPPVQRPVGVDKGRVHNLREVPMPTPIEPDRAASVLEVFQAFPERELDRANITELVEGSIAPRTLSEILRGLVDAGVIHRVRMGVYKYGAGENFKITPRRHSGPNPPAKESPPSPTQAPKAPVPVPTAPPKQESTTLSLASELLDILGIPPMGFSGITPEARLNLRLSYALGAYKGKP